MTDRPLVSIEAEHGVLGALMHKPELCESVGSFLDSSHFSDDDCALLYSAILACHSKGQRPDSITLSEIVPELPSGDMTIVSASQIMRDVPSAANGMTYAKVVKERHGARKLHEAGRRLMELAEQRGDLAEQYAAAQAQVMELGEVGDKQEVYTLAESLGPVFDEMEERRNKVKKIGIDFGLPALDKIVRSMRPGNLVVIAGRPGTGKTVLGSNLAEKIAIQDKGAALFFSLEMPKEELAKRTMAAQSEVPQHLLEDGSCLDNDDLAADMRAAVSVMSKADMRICEIGALPFNRLCAIARFQHRAKPLDVIVIDFLGLIGPDKSWRQQNRNLELGMMSRGLKALAKELGIPIIALAQLNRSIEGRAVAKPKMSDLRDSGEIEQDADVIIIAHRDEANTHGKAGVTEVEVVKVRHAQKGGCLLQLQGEIARFVPSALTADQYAAGAKREDDESKPKSSTASYLR